MGNGYIEPVMARYTHFMCVTLLKHTIFLGNFYKWYTGQVLYPWICRIMGIKKVSCTNYTQPAYYDSNRVS